MSTTTIIFDNNSTTTTTTNNSNTKNNNDNDNNNEFICYNNNNYYMNHTNSSTEEIYNTATTTKNTTSNSNYNGSSSVSSFTTLLTVFGTDPYIYQSTNIIQYIHHNAIRFGKTSNISVVYDTTTTTTTTTTTITADDTNTLMLVSSSSSSSLSSNNDTTTTLYTTTYHHHPQRNEYIIGVSITSILICTFILLWFGILLLLRYLGPQRVGILSGTNKRNIMNRNHYYPITTTTTSTNTGIPTAIDEEQEEEKENEEEGIEEEEKVAECDHNNVQISPLQQQQQEIQQQQKQQQQQQQYRLLNCYRIIITLSCIGNMICIILFVLYGISNLHQSSNHIINGLELGQSLSLQAYDILDTFIQQQSNIVITLISYIDTINDLCPTITNTSICSNTTTTSSSTILSSSSLLLCNFTNININIINNNNTNLPILYTDIFIDAFHFVLDNIDNITEILYNVTITRSDLIQISTEFEHLMNQVSNLRWIFTITAFLECILLCCHLCIVYIIIIDWYHERNQQQQQLQMKQSIDNNMENPTLLLSHQEDIPSSSSIHNNITQFGTLVRRKILLPTFCILVIISWFFSMIFVIGSITTADFCYDTPDDTVIELLQQDIIPLSLVMRNLMIFYVSGCPATTELVNEFDTELDLFVSYIEHINIMNHEIQTTTFIQSIIERCNTDPIIINASIHALQSTVCNLSISYQELLQFFSCNNWRPIYRLVTYDAICFNGNEGFYYVAWTQFWIVFFSMITITLRAVYTPECSDNIHSTTTANDNLPPSEEIVSSENVVQPNNDANDNLLPSEEIASSTNVVQPNNNEHEGTNTDTQLQSDIVNDEHTNSNSRTLLVTVNSDNALPSDDVQQLREEHSSNT